jgi:hypothetical protein
MTAIWTNPAPADEEYSLPVAEAQLAATLALMTGHAQACCEAHRHAMARKIVGHLAELGRCDRLSFHFKALLASLRGRWVAQCAPEEVQALPPVQTRFIAWQGAPKGLK